MSESKRSSSESPRRVYKTPKLRSYGNIRDITRDIGNKGPNDSFPPTKPAGVKRTGM